MSRPATKTEGWSRVPAGAALMTLLLTLTMSSCALPGTKSATEPATAPATSAPPASQPPETQPATPAGSAPASGAPATASAAPSSSAPSSSAPSGAPRQDAGAVVATKKVTGYKGGNDDDAHDLTLTVHAIHRDGGLSRIDFTIMNTSSEDWTPHDNLATGGLDGNTNAVELVDPVNLKAYLPASDSDGECECTANLNYIAVAQNASADFYDYFAAPPSSVHSMTVRFPIFGEVTNVPVQ